MKVGLQVNDRSIRAKLKSLEESVQEDLKDDLRVIINFAAERTPVDTGAYAKSWSLKGNYSSGRSVTSRGKPRGQSVSLHRNIARENLLFDLSKIDFSEANVVVLSNGAPHAPSVERRHYIFSSIRSLGYR